MDKEDSQLCGTDGRRIPDVQRRGTVRGRRLLFYAGERASERGLRSAGAAKYNLLPI
jgi:hypothetical protein